MCRNRNVRNDYTFRFFTNIIMYIPGFIVVVRVTYIEWWCEKALRCIMCYPQERIKLGRYIRGRTTSIQLINLFYNLPNFKINSILFQLFVLYYFSYLKNFTFKPYTDSACLLGIFVCVNIAM